MYQHGEGVTDEVTFQAKKLKENKSLLKMNSRKKQSWHRGHFLKDSIIACANSEMELFNKIFFASGWNSLFDAKNEIPES